MFREFKQFIARGNIVEIAVGLIIAVAFKSVVDSLVADVITPIVGAVFGQPDFSRLSIEPSVRPCGQQRNQSVAAGRSGER